MVLPRRTDREDPAFLELVRALDEELWERYPRSQQAYVAGNAIAPGASVVVAEEGGLPVGCGCFRRVGEGVVELKRMFVRRERRGTGAAAAILAELEAWARESGALAMRLETGVKQPEALRFYEKRGYSRMPNYGDYEGNPESVCMEKPLGPR